MHTKAASPIDVGTKITIHWPPSKLLEWAANQFQQLVRAYVWFNPHLSVRGVWFGYEFINAKATNPDWEKWRPRNPTSAYWYDEARLQRYLAAHVARDRDLGQRRTVREFIAEFRGLSGTALQRKILNEVGCSHQSLARFFGTNRVNRAGVAKLLGGDEGIQQAGRSQASWRHRRRASQAAVPVGWRQYGYLQIPMPPGL